MADAFEIFERLLDLPDGQRESALAESCAGDDALRREVAALLAADEEAEGFLEPQPIEERADALSSGVLSGGARLGFGAPEAIGPYRVERQIGEGGFGIVYSAVQSHPIKRRVALKVIKPGMDSAAVLRRFEAERRALAMLDHPNIARVLDAGLVPDGQPGAGRPFFAMELVEGRPITGYAAESSLTLDGRLELVLQICAAAQHAHTKGIVHRDLKPANILVADLDGRPACKVIDFGIAKALGDSEAGVTQLTALTSPGAMIGTPQYMSPEQARGSADIDTRTDVYAIGVVLYELLAGVPPFDAETLRSTDLESLRKLIETVAPPAPSVRRGETSGEGPRFRNELDWITMRALEKDPDRRYPTVAALADDLERFRRSEPVSAARPSRVYRFSKFVRRNRVGFTAGCVAALGIVAGSAFSVWFGVRAEAAREAEAEQRTLAERNESRVLSINTFLTRDLFTAAAITNLGPDATIPALLEQVAPEIDTRFAGDDAMRAEMHGLVGAMFQQTDRYDDARFHFDTAIGLIESGADVRRSTARETYGGRSTVFQIVGELDLAEADAQKAIEITDEGLASGARWATAYARAGSLNKLAMVRAAKGQFVEADVLFQEVISALRAFDDFDFLAQTLSARASNLWKAGRVDDAAEVSREMVRLGDSLETRGGKIAALTGRFWLTMHLKNTGRLTEATEIALGVVERMPAITGGADPNYAGALIQAAGLLTETGRYPEAAPMIERSLEIYADVFGPRHYEVERHSNIAAALHLTGGNAEAARAARTRGLMLRLYIAGPGEAESVLGIIPASIESFGSGTEFPLRVIAEIDALAASDPLASQFGVNAGLALAAHGFDDEAERAYHLAYEGLGSSERPERTRATLAERLSAFYRERDRDADADAWIARLGAPPAGEGDG
jgi:serine/threonine protein kinase/tetratricopeptide (TPR) repeat protein